MFSIFGNAPTRQQPPPQSDTRATHSAESRGFYPHEVSTQVSAVDPTRYTRATAVYGATMRMNPTGMPTSWWKWVVKEGLEHLREWLNEG